jgi:hypothetical protein
LRNDILAAAASYLRLLKERQTSLRAPDFGKKSVICKKKKAGRRCRPASLTHLCETQPQWLRRWIA